MKKPLFQGRVFVETPFLSCMLFGIWLILIKSEVLIMTAVADPDLQIRGPRSSRPRYKGGGGGRSQKKDFRLFCPQLGLKIRGARPPGPLPWIRHWIGMLRPVSCDKWKPPQDWHIMRLVLKVPALETVGRMYSCFLPKGKENPRGYWYIKLLTS